METPIVPADTTFSSVTAIDLGDRAVELVHPGRGHTGGDLVVRLDDADVLLAGDLVEESGMPAYGDDCWPLEWPWSLDLVLELVGPDTVVVPGHGAPVGRDFVQDQRSAIGVVAETIRDLAGARSARRPGAGVDRVALPARAPRRRRTTWLRAAAPRLEAAAARMSPPPLTTSRLLLRQWRASDRAPFAELNADPEVMRHIREPMTQAQSDGFAARIEEHLETDGYGLWAVEVRESGTFVGFVGLAHQTFEAPFNPSVEVGWRLAREAWGHGYATEGGRAALEHAFAVLGLDEVVSITTAGNLRSQAVMRRLGMTRDPADDFEQVHFPADNPLRHAVLHRLSRERWESRS